MRWSAGLLVLAACAAFAACSSATHEAPGAAGPGGDAGGAELSDARAPIGVGATDGGATGPTEDAALGSLGDGGAGAVEDAGGEQADGAIPCAVSGAPGQCITVTACAALTGYTSTPGYCPGAADIECCAETPNVANNPPIPAGYELMAQADVTSAMTTWAVAILNDPTTYPMFSTTTQTFGTQLVLARVEWHPPDFQNSVVHRGVTLYEPI